MTESHINRLRFHSKIGDETLQRGSRVFEMALEREFRTE